MKYLKIGNQYILFVVFRGVMGLGFFFMYHHRAGAKIRSGGDRRKDRHEFLTTRTGIRCDAVLPVGAVRRQSGIPWRSTGRQAEELLDARMRLAQMRGRRSRLSVEASGRAAPLRAVCSLVRVSCNGCRGRGRLAN